MPQDNQKQLPLIKLRREPQDEEGRSAIGFRYAGGDIGDRNYIGGTPQWLQGEDTPRCPHCQGKMTFYGQLDSIGDNFAIADCGLIYVFFCFVCNAAEAVVQSS